MSYQSRTATSRRPVATLDNYGSAVTIRCGPPRHQNNRSYRRNNRNDSHHRPRSGPRNASNNTGGYMNNVIRNRRVTELREQIDNDGFQTVGRLRNPQQVRRQEEVNTKATNRFGGLDSGSDSEEEDAFFRPVVREQWTAAPIGAWGKKLNIDVTTDSQRWSVSIPASMPVKLEKRVTFAEKEEVREIPNRATNVRTEKRVPVDTAEELRKNITIAQELHDKLGDSWADSADKEEYIDEIAGLEARLAKLENASEPQTDSLGRPTNDNSAW